MDVSALEEWGLSNAEAKIYLALLRLGPSTTGNVINSTKLQSSTVYHVLGALLEKGIVSFILKGKIKYYHAESPDTLLTFLDEKKRKLTELLPALKEVERLSSEKQSARVYQGINGLKAAFNGILNTMKQGETYYFFQVPKEKLLNDQVVLFLRNYHLKRAEKGIHVKGLALNTNKKLVEKIFHGIRRTQIRYLAEITPTGLIIYKDKVITLDWDATPTAFIIESRAVAESYKQFFEQKWLQGNT